MSLPPYILESSHCAVTDDEEIAFALQDQICQAYREKQDKTNLYYQQDAHDHKDDVQRGWYDFWRKDGPGLRFLRIIDVPGTYSGDLLRLNANLPQLTEHTVIEGNTVRPFSNPPDPPPELDDDSEDVSSELELLPVIGTTKDPSLYFLKKPNYQGEITNLLKCQGGECPGTPSPYIIQLLGKTKDGELVFPAYLTRSKSFYKRHSLATYKKWVHQLIMGVKQLHELGIVHRDLRFDNLLWTPKLEKSEDGSKEHKAPDNLVIADLESKWGQRLAPEIVHNDATEGAGWSEYSDIWDIGNCIKCIIFGNAPINNVVVWDVLPPFKEIIEACQRPIPTERATLVELLEMLGSVRRAKD